MAGVFLVFAIGGCAIPELEEFYKKRLKRAARLGTFALHHPILLLSWVSTLALGLPLRCALHYDVPLATTLLLSIWLTILALQTAIKSSLSLAPWQLTLLASLSNSVLWTALAMIAYIFADASLSHRPLATMLDTLQTHTPLSTLLLVHASPSSSSSSSSSSPAQTNHFMAAGDLATTLLNSGLVAWGLKLYEHRARLLPPHRLSAALALGNVACGPLLAHALGVALEQGAGVRGAQRDDCVGGTHASSEAGRSAAVTVAQRQGANDPRTVAAGVTVGVNAAAMGTAYLYEVQSEAAPYAALSMIALGVMTVVFSSISPLARWVVDRVAA
ncbi:hypothetical protein NEMBOFW57_001154 [Staphylotrichum longicolle]|uniref:LrgB-like protein n=1 Tax=Staphylotrichum longicolle TaxID=669026 RepID=A0AAD4F5H6_9PEZI|nr:hypothetical protein NEMBOFW57_001154 [Staphylotrichum longicolle]